MIFGITLFVPDRLIATAMKRRSCVLRPWESPDRTGFILEGWWEAAHTARLGLLRRARPIEFRAPHHDDDWF
jgi:hypothetical protein